MHMNAIEIVLYWIQRREVCMIYSLGHIWSVGSKQSVSKTKA